MIGSQDLGLRGDPPGTLEPEFEELRARLAADLEALRFPHPLGLELNLYQWIDIAGAHERRHLAQIEAIAASPGFPRGSG